MEEASVQGRRKRFEFEQFSEFKMVKAREKSSKLWALREHAFTIGWLDTDLEGGTLLKREAERGGRGSLLAVICPGSIERWLKKIRFS